jgi:hypothetical protein
VSGKIVFCSFVIGFTLKYEPKLTLESLLISIRNCIQNAPEEEPQIPSESLLMSIRNSRQNALEEEPHIPLEL